MQLVNPPSFQQISTSLEENSPAIVLAAHNLGKTYGRGKRQFEAVRQVSLSLRRGEVLAFLGPNGAGKTTTIKMIAGLVRPDRGQVSILGADPHRHSRALRHIGAVLEGNRNLYWRLTPEENLEYFGVLRQVPRRLAQRRGIDLLEQFGLTDKRKTPVQKLSRGMQQKVAIAVALIHQPQLLLLDEPTLGLDVEASETVKGLIRQIAAAGCAILLTTHQLDVAEELSDRVAIIRRGRMVAEKSTRALLAEFSGSTYHLEVDGHMTPNQVQRVEALGGTVQDSNWVLFAGDSAVVYSLIAVLNPLPLVSIQRDRADLTQVFLQIVKDAQDDIP